MCVACVAMHAVCRGLSEQERAGRLVCCQGLAIASAADMGASMSPKLS